MFDIFKFKVVHSEKKYLFLVDLSIEINVNFPNKNSFIENGRSIFDHLLILQACGS